MDYTAYGLRIRAAPGRRALGGGVELPRFSG